MIKKSLLDILFKGFSIQRWNDKLRPIELIEMDKHAHKMMIAYCLGKYEEQQGHEFDWHDIIKGGIFELLRRITISDIQSPVFMEIEKNEELLIKLNTWVNGEIRPKIGNSAIRDEFEDYLLKKDKIHPRSRLILNAAHKYATYWEFQIIKNLNVNDYKIPQIDGNLTSEIHEFKELKGIDKLIHRDKVVNFIDLCGQMRYQIRWGQLPRIPKTSVLGHSFFVSILSYLFTRELPNSCEKRLYNNFFGGLFHDLPEAVTRDIISPLKSDVPGMSDEIKRIEEKLTLDEIYPHIEPEWREELEYFTHEEFESKIKGGEITTSEEINEKYNKNVYNPYDGKIVRSADKLAAFLEAWNSINLGIKSNEIESAMSTIRNNHRRDSVAGLSIGEIYEDFG